MDTSGAKKNTFLSRREQQSIRIWCEDSRVRGRKERGEKRRGRLLFQTKENVFLTVICSSDYKHFTSVKQKLQFEFIFILFNIRCF